MSTTLAHESFRFVLGWNKPLIDGRRDVVRVPHLVSTSVVVENKTGKGNV